MQNCGTLRYTCGSTFLTKMNSDQLTWKYAPQECSKKYKRKKNITEKVYIENTDSPKISKQNKKY